MRIGKNMTRIDAFDRAAGDAKCIAGLGPQGLLAAKVIYNTIVNGVVKSFDLEEALEVPGIMKIATCFDMPDIQFPTPSRPWSVEMARQDIAGRKLLSTRVWVCGDDIAAVIAENGIVTIRAARPVKMEYEEYAPLLTVEDAMAEDAPRLHDEKPEGVIAHPSFMVGEGTYGDVMKEEGLVEVKKDYRTQSMQHCRVETPTSFAYMEKGRVTIITPAQIPHIVRRVISQALELSMGRIRVIELYISGGFGNKQDILCESLNAFLTTQVGGMGTRMEVSKEETLGCTRVRHTIEFKVRATARRDGTLVTRRLEAYSNQGGYASRACAIIANSPNEFKQIYKDEKMLGSDAWTVYTDLATGGTMRRHGTPQAAFAAECMADDLALALRMDPLEFRRKNCMRSRYVDLYTHVKCSTYDLAECMGKIREFIC